MRRYFALAFAALIFLPSGFLILPRPAHAVGDVVLDPTNLVENTLSALMSKLISDSSTSLELKEYVLDPIAWALSNQMIQQLTGSILSFVDGNGNGTGSPQFVQDLQGFLQQVGDNQALSFITQFSQNSNSPFSTSIASALRTNYLGESSLGGYFAQNQCTLSQSSSDINAYLGGDWSKGGLSAWFALIQDQNNPYIQYQSAYGEQNSLIASADAAQVTQLNWGQGFLSWCASDDTDPNAQPGQYGANPPLKTACLKSDGTSGVIDTPGSVILAYTNKATGLGLDKLVSADEIDELISQLATQLISGVLGGSSGGLFGISQSSDGSSSSLLDSYSNDSGVLLNQGNDALNLANQRLADVNSYKAQWDGVVTSAQDGITRLQSLAVSCPAVAGTEQSLISTKLTPVLQQAQSTSQSAQATKDLALKVQSEAQTVSSASTAQLAQDVQQLTIAPPSQGDIIVAQSTVQSLSDQVNTAIQQGESAATPALCNPPTQTP